MLPAQERLEADERPVDADQRLVVQRQLATREGVAELVLDPETYVPRRRVGDGDDPARPTLALGDLGCTLPLPQQLRRLRRGALGADQTRARADDQLVLADDDRAAHGGEDEVAEITQRLLGVLDALADHDELVADDVRDGVGGGQRGGEVAGDRREQLVALLESEGVVDPLDVVEVQIGQDDVAAVCLGAHQGLRDAVGEEALVGQSGQRVVQGRVRQLRLGLAHRGDVLEGDEDPGVARLGLVGEVHPHRDDPHRPAIGEDQPAVRSVERDLAATAYGLPRGGEGLGALVGVDDADPGRADELRGGPAQQDARCVVDLDEAQVLVQEQLWAG